jgi:hypothetical protein
MILLSEKRGYIVWRGVITDFDGAGKATLPPSTDTKRFDTRVNAAKVSNRERGFLFRR